MRYRFSRSDAAAAMTVAPSGQFAQPARRLVVWGNDERSLAHSYPFESVRHADCSEPSLFL